MLNKVFLIGNVGRDPESYGESGKIAKFSLATSERSVANGTQREFVEWHNIVAYGKMAEIVLQHVHKGSKLHIEGKVTYKQWENERTKQKMYRTEIELRQVLFLGSSQAAPAADNDPAGGGYANPEDLPF